MGAGTALVKGLPDRLEGLQRLRTRATAVRETAGASGDGCPTVTYDQWKRRGRHLEEYASEALGTAFLVFCVVAIVSVMFAASSPLPVAIPSVHLRLLLTGLLLGASSWLVALTPLGRLSGAHLNPAVTVGFYVLGKLHARDALGYALAQMTGGLLGAFLGHTAFGHFSTEVQNGALIPQATAGITGIFAAEVAATFVLTFVIYTCTSDRKLMRWTLAAATLTVGMLVCVDGTYSGCGMNPARWFGPAAAAGDWHHSAAYTVGPLCGAALAALVRRFGFGAFRIPHTGKLLHDSRYRSVFRQDKTPTQPPRGVTTDKPAELPD